MQRWLVTIPEYVDWQIRQQQKASIYQLEQRKSQLLAPGLEIYGRLDRIDKDDTGYILFDYKTGITPSQKDIEQGEDVQLLSYATLMEQVGKISYLSLDKGEVKEKAQLEADRLRGRELLLHTRLR